MSSVTQTAAAFQRNTRPITQDEPLPVYGQETVRTVPLPHYHPGKVSFIVHPSVKTTTKFYNLLDALTDLGNNMTMFKDFQRLKFLYFPCPKIGKSEFSNSRFGLRRVRKDLFHGQREFFLLGQPWEITSGLYRCAHLTWSSSQSE